MIDIQLCLNPDHKFTVAIGGSPPAGLACDIAFPRPCKFLTLAEQVESMLRFDGRWSLDAARQFEKALRDLSDPAEVPVPELVRWVRKPSTDDFPAHVRWRVNLARADVAFQCRPNIDLSVRHQLTAEIWAADDWPPPVLEVVGRWLSAWARLGGTAHLKTDCNSFQGIADVIIPKPPLPTTVPPGPVLATAGVT
ncbi:MAG: hypothetical protein K2X82_18320 [Gemmataceae bacterium]|nr:hypothetical protein [Gemmataceae bacterium]